jgi:hypothetical protein
VASGRPLRLKAFSALAKTNCRAAAHEALRPEAKLRKSQPVRRCASRQSAGGALASRWTLPRFVETALASQTRNRLVAQPGIAHKIDSYVHLSVS